MGSSFGELENPGTSNLDHKVDMGERGLDTKMTQLRRANAQL